MPKAKKIHQAQGDTIIQNVQIAVVDKDHLTRGFVVDVMTYCVNRRVLAFEGIDEIFSFLKQGNKLHLVFVNIDLPGSKRFELLKTLKPNFPDTYLITMSGNPADQTPADALGADVFLAKPFALGDLFKIVQAYVVDRSGKKQNDCNSDCDRQQQTS